ncbi:META domain-containing protein [Brumimicrobium oceani]|uniref:DUF306 domain-containing protein n=1 Tax=Brumimicrobium oceani TaxID=2100725 RepID=A0A2U2XBU0_9FLAO|nr:META domain-containing protein [Brumimicrobium oceani]PWH85171.1 hypothetical protein DIT68_11080 [Brumimicrobium oceani]
MKFRSVLPFVAGLAILQACSTPKNEIMWVGGFQTECDAGAGKSKCLKVYNGEDLENQKWENMFASIEGFEYEAGYMKKIEVNKVALDAEKVPADASSIQYKMVKELEKKADPRVQLNGDWVLTSINGGNINRMIVLPTMKIELNTMSISGNGGCNLYSTQISELTTQNIKLASALGTLMACANENIEEEYQEALSKVEKYTLKGEELEFQNKEGKVILTYIRVDESQANPALGGSWKNISILGEELTEGQKNPEIIFDLDKLMIAGTDGCNNFNGPIENASSTELKFGAIAGTKMMCPEMDIPDSFLLNLSRAVTYSIDGAHLVLFDKGGKELLVFKK